MALTGIDPNDPTPRDARELLFGAGEGSTGESRDVLLYGNRTAAGSEPVDALGDPVADDQDAQNRCGVRSELYSMYRTYTAIDSGASIYIGAVPESAGAAASCVFEFVGTSDANSTVTATILGLDIPYSVAIGDTPTVSAAGLSAAINNADQGMLMVTTSPSVGDCTVTCSQLGPRGDFVIGDTAKRGARVRIKTSSGTNAQTVLKKTFIAGTTADDASVIIAAASNQEIRHHVAPFHTDSGAGATATFAAGTGSITFADADPDTITRDDASFISDGYAAGMSITIGSSVSNDGTYLIQTVTALVITLEGNESLTAEVLAVGTLVSTGKFGLGGTTAVSPTDNQTGELLDMVVTQALPINGKEQVCHFGQVGTNAQAIAPPTDSDANTVRAEFWWSQNNDYTPGMVAAEFAAIVRSQQITHPSANLAGYSNSDSTPLKIQAPFFVADRPTATEIRTALNNGVSVVGVTAKGRPYIVRQITSRSENSAGDKDYRAREGHLTSAIDFTWELVRQRWQSQKQPFVADDPADGQPPTLKTSTPSSLKGIIFKVIDDLTSSKPLGIYDGPILAPDMGDQMKASVVVTKITAGLTASANLYAVQHLLKSEFKLLETSPAY